MKLNNTTTSRITVYLLIAFAIGVFAGMGLTHLRDKGVQSQASYSPGVLVGD